MNYERIKRVCVLRKGPGRLILGLCVALGGLLGCAEPGPEPQDQGPRAGGNPLAKGEFQRSHERVSGPVLEVLEAGSYTYFKVGEGQQRRWIVVQDTRSRDAETLAFECFGRRHNFQSKRLDRVFEELHFCSLRI